MASDERFGKLSASLFIDSETMRHTAADALVAHCQRHGIYRTEIQFGHGADLIARQNSIIKRLCPERDGRFAGPTRTCNGRPSCCAPLPSGPGAGDAPKFGKRAADPPDPVF